MTHYIAPDVTKRSIKTSITTPTARDHENIYKARTLLRMRYIKTKNEKRFLSFCSFYIVLLSRELHILTLASEALWQAPHR